MSNLDKKISRLAEYYVKLGNQQMIDHYVANNNIDVEYLQSIYKSQINYILMRMAVESLGAEDIKSRHRKYSSAIDILVDN